MKRNDDKVFAEVRSYAARQFPVKRVTASSPKSASCQTVALNQEINISDMSQMPLSVLIGENALNYGQGDCKVCVDGKKGE